MIALGECGAGGVPTTYVTPWPELAARYSLLRGGGIPWQGRNIAVIFEMLVNNSAIVNTLANTLRPHDDPPDGILTDQCEWLLQRRRASVSVSLVLFAPLCAAAANREDDDDEDDDDDDRD